MTVTSPLPAGSLPGFPAIGPPPDLPMTGPPPPQGQVGNTAGLFPTISPSPTPNSPREAGVSQVADSAALPQGASTLNAQLAGLAALALAFGLAVTRLSIRRGDRQSADQPGPPGPESHTDTGKAAGKSGTQ